MRELGASGLSFDTILASGINSSKPHAHPMHKPVELGEAITMVSAASMTTMSAI